MMQGRVQSAEHSGVSQELVLQDFLCQQISFDADPGVLER